MAETSEEPVPHPPAFELLAEAALAAEHQVGPDPDDATAERHLLWRLLRGAFGFVLVGAGIALLPLPGPGWLVILAGLSLLPFRWARRLVAEIRRRVPGVPEEGRIPVRTKVAYGAVIVTVTTVLVLFGGALGDWVLRLGDPDRLLR